MYFKRTVCSFALKICDGVILCFKKMRRKENMGVVA